MAIVAATPGGEDGLTIGEVAKYLERVKVPVNINGVVMQHIATFQIDTDMDTWEPGSPLKWHEVEE